MINRRISLRITKAIIEHRIPLTPNIASVTSFLIGVISLPLYIVGQSVIAGLLVQTSSVADGIDGELARGLGMATRWGGFFDAVLDRIADTIIMSGAIYYALLHQGHGTIVDLIVYLLAISGPLIVSYLHLRSQHDLEVHPMLTGLTPSIASRDVRLFVLFIGSLVGLVYESLVLVALLSYIYITAKLIELSSLHDQE